MRAPLIRCDISLLLNKLLIYFYLGIKFTPPQTKKWREGTHSGQTMQPEIKSCIISMQQIAYPRSLVIEKSDKPVLV